ncbi:hypothetical protein BG011_005469 [Mortierella polycephala]|uniref:Protein-serine/threonine kinase n=1 Tax=Mortierella polycephala TaxID=41804 RepID=A0A9P6QC45_9FUNG|nr:hypothetical protein BG011_005469 [Mortierella polycephala]
MLHSQKYAGLTRTITSRWSTTPTRAVALPTHHANNVVVASKRSLCLHASTRNHLQYLQQQQQQQMRRTTYLSAPSSSVVSVSPSMHRLSSIKCTGAWTATRGFISLTEQKEVDDVMSFYDDKVTQYANQDIQTVTLKTLLGLGRAGLPASESSSGLDSTPEAGSGSGSSSTDSISPHDLAINLDVARYARKELPVRLARLIKATQKLPFIVGTNPFIKRVYKLYYDSFQTITASPNEIQNKEDLDRFADMLQGLVASHSDVVPMLSQGFLECKKYMGKEDIKKFLDGMIRARIGIRLIAEQVISLREQRYNDDRGQTTTSSSSSSSSPSKSSPQGGIKRQQSDDVVGVVHTELRPADLIKTCASFVQELCDVNYGSSPEVVINGQTETRFTYVPVHLEYILCELLKNALRATVEQSQKMGRSALNPRGRDQDMQSSEFKNQGGGNSVVIVNQADDDDPTKRPNEFGHPPVEVTIAQGDHEITIRIRDQGGGISREDMDAIFEYSFTTVKNENDVSNNMDAGAGDSPYGVDNIFKGVSRLAMQAGLGGPIAGLGFGLPLTRIYAQYFGGDMHLVSLQGYGCDVFLKLKQIDETLDDLQI